MKKIVIAITALSLMCTACTRKPTDPLPRPTSASGLFAKWKLVKSEGGIAGRVLFPLAGEQSFLLFKPDSTLLTIETTATGTRTTTASFTVSPIAPTPDGFAYELDQADLRPVQYFKFSGDTLVLKEYMISDGFIYWYVRDQVPH